MLTEKDANRLSLQTIDRERVTEVLPEPFVLERKRSVWKAWLRRHRLSICIVTALVLVAAAVHLAGMHRYPGPRDDEGTYVAQAWALQNNNTLSHYTFIYDHPPLGTLILALWTWITGAFDRVEYGIGAGRELAFVAQMVSTALLYVLARRLELRRPFAAAAVALFTLTPLALAYHRLFYLDNLVMPWLLAAFILALSPRRHLAAVIGSALCFAAAVLTKETVLLLLPALLYQLWRNADGRTRRMSLALFGSVLAVAIAFYPLYAALKGELFPGEGHVSLLGGIWWQLFDRPGTGSVLEPASIAHRQILEWFDYDKLLPFAGVAALVPALLSRRLRPYAVGLGVLLVALLRDGYMPIPYIVVPIAFMCLLIAGVADAAWARARRSGVMPALAVGAALLTLTALAVPSWARGTSKAVSTNDMNGLLDVEAWVIENVPRDSVIVADSTFWLDLVNAGWSTENVIWHEKLGQDPEVGRRLARGWRSIDYVISTAGPRNEVFVDNRLPMLRQALLNSTPLKVFGFGGNRIEVLKVEG